MKKILLVVLIPFVTGLFYAQISHFLGIENENRKIFLSALVFTISSLLTFSITKPENPKALLWIYVSFSLSWLLWDLTIRFLEGWNESIFTLPRLLCQLTAIFFSYQIFSKKIKNIAIGFLILSILTFTIIKYLNPIALNYTNYGNYNSTDKFNALYDWNIILSGARLTNDLSKDKYIVLDFWSVSCSICYTKFPILDQLYKKYNNKDNIEILSVLIQYNNLDSIMALDKIKSNNYSFPIALGDSTTEQTFNIISFPTVLIIYKGVVIYKGSIENAANFLSKIK